MSRITPELLLKAYSIGVFPMAEARDDPRLHWIEPEARGILPLETFHVPRRLARTIRTGGYEMRTDHDFPAIIRACAEATDNRPSTWINEPIEDLYIKLHRMGFAHSVETWRDEQLVGGLYGVALGAAFFGESMFSRERDASKVALVHLVDRLKRGGFRLLDTQFVTAHLARFGTVEVPRNDYRRILSDAVSRPAAFHPERPAPPLPDFLRPARAK
jgi:leucyl/phenylalanyl-tRNA--protein transferase